MVATRLSQLQKRILRWVATAAQHTLGVLASSHQELVSARQGDKGNSSHSLRTLEPWGWRVIGRSAGGKAASLRLTPEGQQWADQVAGSGDVEGEHIETNGCEV
jgi:hypothetical protein